MYVINIIAGSKARCEPSLVNSREFYILRAMSDDDNEGDDDGDACHDSDDDDDVYLSWRM